MNPVQTSSAAEVRGLYDETADSYSDMMDSEISHQIYADTFSRLAERIADLSGPVIDSSCGSGHMLSLYHEKVDPERSLVGVDLSPNMAAIASARLGSSAEIVVGDMRDLREVESGSAAAVLSFFAIHHLNPNEGLAAFQEWHRTLRYGGQLVVAAWEGTGPIDYGGETDVVALRYGRDEVADWARQAGFDVDRCVVEPVEEMPMKAVYLDGTRT